jgi:uncharacterized protein (UPF0548 family)
MFLATRPSTSAIDRFLRASQDLPLSYGPIGILDHTSRRIDEQVVTIGRGRKDFGGFWSLNGCRVVYHLADDDRRFGFAYGTLTNHAEAGEELFALELDPATETVSYRIRAVSWPRAALAFIGQPVVRHLQARFRRDSAVAMAHSVAAATVLDK